MFGNKLNPRLFIICFFVGKDSLDDQLAMNIIIEHETNEEYEQSPIFGIKNRIREFLSTSGIVNLIKNSLWNLSWFRHLFNKLEIRNDRIAIYDRENNLYQDLLYSTTFSALDKIREWSNNNNIPILMVLIPDHLQIIDKSIFVQYELNKPQQTLIKHLKEIDIQYIELLHDFTNSEKPQELFFREDKHWRAETHHFVAGIIYNYLVNHTTFLSNVKTEKSVRKREVSFN